MDAQPGGTTAAPVANSLVAADFLARQVSARYELGATVSCRYWNPGVNDTYLVQSGRGRSILRVYRHDLRSAEDVGYELEHLRLLDGAGVPVAEPLLQRDGATFWALPAPEGERYAALFRFAAGGEVAHGPEQTGRYGQALARVHTATDGYRSGYRRFGLDLAHLLEQPLRAIAPLLEHRPADWAYLQRVAAAVRERVARLPVDLDVGFCHGDPHGQNAHVDDTGTLRFFDFDCCGHGWRAYDLATFRWGPVGRDDALWQAFLSGYGAERPLRAADLDAVPLFVALRHIWLWGLHAANAYVWGHGWLDDGYWDAGGAGGFAFLRPWVEAHFPEVGA